MLLPGMGRPHGPTCFLRPPNFRPASPERAPPHIHIRHIIHARWASLPMSHPNMDRQAGTEHCYASPDHYSGVARATIRYASATHTPMAQRQGAPAWPPTHTLCSTMFGATGRLPLPLAGSRRRSRAPAVEAAARAPLLRRPSEWKHGRAGLRDDGLGITCQRRGGA